MEGASYTSALECKRMNLWFLSWLLSENSSPSQSRQTKYELRAVSSKVDLLQDTNTLQNKVPEQMVYVLKPDISWGALNNPRKDQSGSIHLFLSWAGSVSTIIVVLEDLWHKGRYWRWANHFPGKHSARCGRGAVTDQGGGREVRRDTAEWHWDLFWQCVGTKRSPVIALETQGARQMIKQLPLCVADATVSENALWLGCRPEGVLQICEQHKTLHCNDLLILAIGEHKMAGCLEQCAGAIVFLKNMYCFWRINSTSYLPWIYSL